MAKQKSSGVFGKVYVTVVTKNLRKSGTEVTRLYAQGQPVLKAVGNGEVKAKIARVLEVLGSGELVPQSPQEVIDFAASL